MILVKKMIDLINDDCMNVMKKYKDHYFDLAIVDPPYQLGTKNSYQGCGVLKNRKYNKDDQMKEWDIAPKKEYFVELKRVSKNQIIWGGNYFGDYLGKTRGIICWDKVQPFPNFSAWEFAWTSFNKVAKLFKYDNRTGGKIHPTQKPIKLYEWVLVNYAKKGQKILDTHLGSGSSAIATHYFGCDFVGVEINKKYYNMAKIRFNEETKQKTLF